MQTYKLHVFKSHKVAAHEHISKLLQNPLSK
jgi:hypothetical protein